MRWVAAVALIFAVGCGPTDVPSLQRKHLQGVTVLLPDGEAVRCVVVKTAETAALSCDWDNQ